MRQLLREGSIHNRAMRLVASQQARLDPHGTYVRRYLPELRAVPDQYLAQPRKMPAGVQRQAKCAIGRDYPPPIIDHPHARHQALARYAAVKSH